MFDLIVKYLHNEETRKYSFEVPENVHALKEKISNDVDIPIDLITLKRNNEELSDNEVLNSLNCSNNQFIVILKGLISINIKTNLEMFESVNNYATFIFQFDNVSKLKEKLSKLLNISTKIITLKYKDDILANSKSFLEYNICENSELIFGLNLYLIEPDKIDNQFSIINKFIDRNILVSDLIENYCNENKLNKNSIKFEFENKVLSDEFIVDLIKTSVEPIFKVTKAARICFEGKDNNVVETYLFHNETISKLRAMLKLRIDTFEESEILLYEDKILDDSEMLRFYGEKDCYQVFSGFKLLVDCDDISIMPPMFVHNSMTIKNIKLRFADNLQIEWLFINLLIGNDKLDDSKTIKFYRINEASRIDLKIGINIIIFHDDVIEFLVKPETTFQDVKQYISYKCKIDLENIKFMINDEEVKSSDNLVEKAKLISDLIIFVKPKLTVFILHEDGNKDSYQIWDKSKVHHLKELIHANTRIVKESITLKFGNEELNDEKTIDFYNINENSEIQMLIQNRVSIIDNKEEIHLVIIEPCDSILSLKKMLSLKIKEGFSEIHLYQNDKYLEDNQSLQFYHIDFNSLLEMKLGTRIRLVDEFNAKYDLVLDKFSTIGSLKNLLFANFNLEMDKFKLIFDDMELTDDLSIRNFGFNNDSVIKIITKSVPIIHESISIYVCNLTDDFTDFSIISVVIESDWTIKDIKEKVLENRDVDLNSFILTYVGDKLDDKLYFHQYKIQKNHSLILNLNTSCPCEVSSMGIVINVKPKIGNNEHESKIYKYLLDDYQSILILKKKLRDELNVPLDSIILMFQGNELNNNETIRSLDLDNDSTILMVINNQEAQENKDSVKVNIKFSLLEENCESFKEQEIKNSELVGTLKQQIANDFNMSFNSFVLTFNEEIMLDKNSLSIYGLVDGSKIVVCNSIFVKHFSGQSLDTTTVRRFPIELTDTVSILKKRISMKLNIQSDFIKLNFQGEYLNEDKLVKDTEIENESFLMMITTLRGG